MKMFHGEHRDDRRSRRTLGPALVQEHASWSTSRLLAQARFAPCARACASRETPRSEWQRRELELLGSFRSSGLRKEEEAEEEEAKYRCSTWNSRAKWAISTGPRAHTRPTFDRTGSG